MQLRSFLFLSSVASAAFLFATSAQADTVLRYSITTGGGIATTGNSLGLSKALDQNGPGTEDSIGTFPTLEADTFDDFPASPLNPWPEGTTFDWTLNGSEAEIVLPVDFEILYAELVWGGSWSYGTENVAANLDDSIVLTANGDSMSIAPDPATALTIQDVSTEGFAINYYLRSADVTSFVEEHADTFYAAEGIPATQDSLIDELNAAGWSLMVVYRNSAEPIRNLTVFVGGEFVDELAVVDYEVDGFCTPPSGAFEGYATISALEGDADREGDSLTIADSLGGTFTPLVGPNNPEDNFFCSQINDVNGDLDTTGTFGNNNHDAILGNNTLAGRQGWDVTTVPVSSAEGHLEAGQTSAILRAETVGDSFLPTAAGFAIEVNAPDFTGTAAEIAPGTLELDDTATASISTENGGLVNADDLVFTAPLPEGLELESFSINGNDGDVDGNPVTTADLTSGVNVGDVLVGVALDIEFTVRADGPPARGSSWEIQPGWDYTYVSCVGDDPLQEPHSTPPLSLEFDAPAGTTDGVGGEDDGVDDTAGDDSASAEQGDEEDDGGASADDTDDGDADADGGSGGVISASGGMAESDDSGCGCRSKGSGPGGVLALLALLGLVRRRRG